MIRKEDIRAGVSLHQADLFEADLKGANLCQVDLRRADLRGADLSGADLSKADLRTADLKRANLKGANLFGANLYMTDLHAADLSGANLIGADLYAADLYAADLYAADLSGANLIGADLRKANLSNTKGIPPMKCPEKGPYIGYKKAEIWEKDHYAPVIVTLEVPETAKRSSATTNKCRCSEAKVLCIKSLDGNQKYNKVLSHYCPIFVYEVGKIVKVDDFNDDRWAECAPGIHHFMTRKEAEEYWLV